MCSKTLLFWMVLPKSSAQDGTAIQHRPRPCHKNGGAILPFLKVAHLPMEQHGIKRGNSRWTSSMDWVTAEMA